MKKDIIIFDLDGTLLDTLEGLQEGFNYAINNFGYPSRSIDEIRTFVGNGVEKALSLCVDNRANTEELKLILGSFKSYYQKNMNKTTKVYSGIIELLVDLKQRGYKIAVVSNKYDDAVKLACSHFFGELVDVAIGEGNGIERKPNPIGVIKAIEILNSSIEKSIYVGDSEVDILTAKNCGIPCISVLWGFRNKAHLKSNGAEFFVEKPSDIIEFLENNY